MKNNNDYLLVGSQKPTMNTSLTPISIHNGRLYSDSKGYFHWNGISDFYLPKYYKNDYAVDSHLDFYNKVNRNGVRIFCSVNNADGNYPFDLNVIDWIYNKCINKGLIPEFCLFAGRGQYSQEDKKLITGDFCQWLRNTNGDKIVLPQLVNEAQFNDFESAVDRNLIDLAIIMQSWMGNGNFSITDSLDDDVEGSEHLFNIYATLAMYSNILVIHSSRTKTSDQWRWINHLKGFTDVISEAKNRSSNNNVYGIHDEPMGAASKDASNRDSNPNHHVAANFVANCCCLGYTAHWIPEQDANFPGLFAMGNANKINADPSFTFKNAGTSGSAIRSFTGYTKVRVCDNNSEAYAVGYGDPGTVEWDNYSNIEVIIHNEQVTLYHAIR